MTSDKKTLLIQEVAAQLTNAIQNYIDAGRLSLIKGLTRDETNNVAKVALKDFRNAWVKYLEDMSEEDIQNTLDSTSEEWISGFNERWNVEKVLWKAEDRAHNFIGFDKFFSPFWEMIRAEVFDEKTDHMLQAEEYKRASKSYWIRRYEEWEKNPITNPPVVVGGEKNPEKQDAAIQFLQRELTNAAILDSGNRIQSFKKTMTGNQMDMAKSILEERFGEEAKNLFFEILDGLDKQEQSRLEGVPKRKRPAETESMEEETIFQQARKSRQEGEGFQESVERAKNELKEDVEVELEDLDFLDDDIDEVFNLEELENELDLDDFKLD